MQNNNNNNKNNNSKTTFIGLSENQIITINKTYKSVITNDYKVHSMFINDTYKDQTGTWIKTGFYQLKWYSFEDLNINDKVKVTRIKHFEQRVFNSKQGVKQHVVNATIEVQKVEETYSNYGNYNSNNSQYNSYNNNNNDNGYGNYGSYNNYNGYNNYNNNDDFGL